MKPSRPCLEGTVALHAPRGGALVFCLVVGWHRLVSCWPGRDLFRIDGSVLVNGVQPGMLVCSAGVSGPVCRRGDPPQRSVFPRPRVQGIAVLGFRAPVGELARGLPLVFAILIRPGDM